MITFTAPLKVWSGADGKWHFLTVPECFSDEIRAHWLMKRRGFGSVRVGVTVDDVTWCTSIFPSKGKDGYFLPVKLDVCRKIGAVRGDRVEVALELL